MLSGLSISQADGRPMYLQIIEQIRRRIALGDWAPGQEIPSIRVLAAETRVSVITIKRAYLELEREGVITTRRGKGTFVSDTVSLSRQLRSEELDRHLGRAIDVGQEMGMTTTDLEERLTHLASERGLDTKAGQQ
jgi:GntR family transcriptional regulator